MPRRPSPDPLILARYVYLDVVSFSKRTVEDQTYVINSLNRLVLETLAAYSIQTRQRILLPTGDGLCIALVGQGIAPDLHLRIALDLLRRIDEHNQDVDRPGRAFEIRVGINSNVDNAVVDVNGDRNIAGAGINAAQRIMSLADGSQILVGTADVNTLNQRDGYTDVFREYVATVKHGVKIVVYQLVMERPGLNVDVPDQLGSLKLEFPSRLVDVDYLRRLSPEIRATAGLAIRRAAFPVTASADVESFLRTMNHLAETPAVWRTGYEIMLEIGQDPDDPQKYRSDAHFTWSFVNHTSLPIALPQRLYTTPALKVDGKSDQELLAMHQVDTDTRHLSDFGAQLVEGGAASEFTFTVNIPPASELPAGLRFAYKTPYKWDLGQPWFTVVYTPVCEVTLSLVHPDDTSPELYVFGMGRKDGDATPLKPAITGNRCKKWVYDGWLFAQHGLCLVLYPLSRAGTAVPRAASK